MDRYYRLLAIAFFFIAPFWYGPVIYTDLTSPEVWDREPLRDPRLYLPLLAAVAVAGVLLAIYIYFSERTKR